MPAEIDKLTQAIIARDNKLIEETAHKIKGSSANLEAVNLAQCALNIEQEVKRRNSRDIESLSIRLNEDFAELIEKLNDFLSTHAQHQ